MPKTLNLEGIRVHGLAEINTSLYVSFNYFLTNSDMMIFPLLNLLKIMNM